MTDENQQDPKGEKVEEQPEPIRYSVLQPIPESPRGRLARASQESHKREGAEEKPEPPRLTLVESPRNTTQEILASAAKQGTLQSDDAQQTPEEKPGFPGDAITESPSERVKRLLADAASQRKLRTESPEEKRDDKLEPPGYGIVENPSEKAQRLLADAANQRKLRSETSEEKREEKREPLGYAIIETPIETVPVVQAISGKQKKSRRERVEEKQEKKVEEKQEEKEEAPGYEIIETRPETVQGAFASTGQQSSGSERAEEKAEPLGYAIMEAPPEPSTSFFQPAPAPIPSAAGGNKKGGNPKSDPTSGSPAVEEEPSKGIPKSGQRSARFYIWAGVGLGVLFGCVIAVVSWHFGVPDAPHDWGSASSESTGLKGHLFTQWDKKLEYRLTLEPSDPQRRAGFALAVAHPPRPLSIEIHLHDAQGFVLCSREIILKYDTGAVSAVGEPGAEPQAQEGGASPVAGSSSTHGMQELLAAQEAERELGKEVFKNRLGSDGQIAAIDAQGDFPCSEKAYGGAYSWSFTPNFPSLAEQDELRKGQEAQAGGGRPTDETPVARKKVARIPAPPLLSFTIEGDDAIVEFDLSRGAIETRAGKTFLFGKTSGDITNPKWQDFPVSIHYVCDQASACVITHSGAGALRTRLSR